MKNSRTIWIIAAIIIIGVLIFAWSWKSSRDITPPAGGETAPQVTVTGGYVCLPHKDMSGPQTMECALGLHGSSGLYYALDFKTPPTTLKTGDRISVTGTFTPVANLSTNQWQKYPIEGILSVTSFVRV